LKIRGRTGWIPAFLEDEIQDIMRENTIEDQKAALIELVKYCNIGREMERIISLDFSRWKPREKLMSFIKKKKLKEWNGKLYQNKIGDQDSS